MRVSSAPPASACVPDMSAFVCRVTTRTSPIITALATARAAIIPRNSPVCCTLACRSHTSSSSANTTCHPFAPDWRTG